MASTSSSDNFTLRCISKPDLPEDKPSRRDDMVMVVMCVVVSCSVLNQSINIRVQPKHPIDSSRGDSLLQTEATNGYDKRVSYGMMFRTRFLNLGSRLVLFRTNETLDDRGDGNTYMHIREDVMAGIQKNVKNEKNGMTFWSF